ncbi:hypothetical protein [Streptomyces sp. AC550_RSS872]|nr:hypothetical protein [Streptomyces sp. AC550_RSS872]
MGSLGTWKVRPGPSVVSIASESTASMPVDAFTSYAVAFRAATRAVPPS